MNTEEEWDVPGRINALVADNLWAFDRANKLVLDVMPDGKMRYQLPPGKKLELLCNVAEALVEEREPRRCSAVGLNDDAAAGLAQAVYAIEANGYERLALWQESQEREHKLEDRPTPCGGMDTLGFIKVDGQAMPVCVEVSFLRYRGELIALWHLCSQVTDARMVKPWLQTYALKSCDAMNAHNALHEVDRLVEAKEVANG